MSAIEKPPPPDRRRQRLTGDERQEVIRHSILQMLQKLDRILLGHTKLAVLPADDPTEAAGYTTGDDIYINFAWLATKTDEDLVAILGLNYHELAHVIMTPRLKGKLLKQISPEPNPLGFPLTFNIMEDWRIETQFAAIYDTARDYFTITCKKLIIDDHQLRQRGPDEEWSIHLMVMGRYYLDPALRIRYELMARKRLGNSSRIQEITDAMAAGKLKASYLDELTAHYKWVEEVCQDPGLADRHLRLLNLYGDARFDAMNDLAKKYCAGRWYTSDKDENWKMILLVKQMHLLLPMELAGDSPAAGIPMPGNAGDGGKFGVDLPTHQKLDSNELLHDDAKDAAAEIISQDAEQLEKLRELAKGTSIDVDGEEEDEDPDHADFPPSEEELEGEEDEGEDDDDDAASAEGGPGGTEKREKPRDPKILIDPSQSVNTGDKEKDDDDPDSEEEAERFDGHLTGGAGGSTDRQRDERLAQLTREQLSDLDKIFKDAGVIDEILTDEVRALLDQRVIKRDLRNIRQNIAEQLGENLNLDSKLSTMLQPVDSDILQARDRLQRQLEEIRSLLEGTWRDDEPSGKVNLRRLLNAPPSQRGSIYRHWIQDEIDEAGLELVVLLDRSSSMASAIDHASQMCWMIASAVQKFDGRVHVISFADEDKTEVLLTPKNRLSTNQYQPFGTYGGTYCSAALELALKVIKGSHMPNSMVAIVTDGAWSDLDESVRVLQKINAYDCDTVLMGMGLDMQRDRRGCKHVVHVNDIDRASQELRLMVRRINENVLRRITQNRGFVND